MIGGLLAAFRYYNTGGLRMVRQTLFFWKNILHSCSKPILDDGAKSDCAGNHTSVMIRSVVCCDWCLTEHFPRLWDDFRLFIWICRGFLRTLRESCVWGIRGRRDYPSNLQRHGRLFTTVYNLIYPPDSLYRHESSAPCRWIRLPHFGRIPVQAQADDRDRRNADFMAYNERICLLRAYGIHSLRRLPSGIYQRLVCQLFPS